MIYSRQRFDFKRNSRKEIFFKLSFRQMMTKTFLDCFFQQNEKMSIDLVDSDLTKKSILQSTYSRLRMSIVSFF